MRAVRQTGGYTIVETIIFLAISSALFVIAYNNVFSNRGRTEFSQGVRELENQLQDIMNDVENGYYPYSGGHSCTAASGNTVNISSGSTALGQSGDCLFAGRILSTPVGSPFTLHTLVAPRRVTISGVTRDIHTISEADAKLHPGTVADFRVPYSLNITDVERPGGGGTAVRSIGFITTFTANNSAAIDKKGTFTKTQLAVFDSTYSGGVVDAASISNAAEGVFVCIKSNTSDQKALLRIGGANQQLTTTSYFDNAIASIYGGCTP